MTRLWDGRPRNRGSIPGTDRDFSLVENAETRSGAIQLAVVSFLWVKWPRREADNTSPSSAEVKTRKAVPALLICLHGVHKDKCIRELYSLWGRERKKLWIPGRRWRVMLTRVLDTSSWWRPVVNRVPQAAGLAVPYGSLNKAVRRWNVKLEDY